MNCGVVWATGDGRQPSAREAPESSVFDNPEPAVATREIANNLTAIAEGILAHPTGGAFACALATDCGESALVMNSHETARRSHAEPRRSLAAAALDPCLLPAADLAS